MAEIRGIVLHLTRIHVLKSEVGTETKQSKVNGGSVSELILLSNKDG